MYNRENERTWELEDGESKGRKKKGKEFVTEVVGGNVNEYTKSAKVFLPIQVI